MVNVKVRKSLSILLIVSFLFTQITFKSGWAKEEPKEILQGYSGARVLFNNINYEDVRASNTWSKAAIYEISALGMMKGYGNKNFGHKEYLTKEQALAIIYNGVGREAEAQIMAEALNNARRENERKELARSVWADGYLQLAANDGLITFRDLADAFNNNQQSLDENNFLRTAPAQRQEIAYWFARLLDLEPFYEQQKIFNNYNDWELTEPDKIPYIEAILQNNIMHGDGNGNFFPRDLVTREQAAQILKNASHAIYPQQGYSKKTGTIEELLEEHDYTHSNRVIKQKINIRNSDGDVSQIIVETPDVPNPSTINERTEEGVLRGGNDLLVFKDEVIGLSEALKKGDRVEYIIDQENKVRFVNVISSVYDTKYFIAQINEVNTENKTIRISRLINMDYPNMELEYINFAFDSQEVDKLYNYSNAVTITFKNEKIKPEEIINGSIAKITLTNDLIVDIKEVDFTLVHGEKGVVNGIVEDNNPNLGYITLYNEDGTGVNSNQNESMPQLRTYTYVSSQNIDVRRNHKPAQIEDIEVGDRAFIKLDEDGNILAISSVDNYTYKYARVISKTASMLAVEYDDGSQQILEVSEKVPVFINKIITEYSEIKEGDRIRLLLNINNRATEVKEITINNAEQFITNIYKGTISHIDKLTNQLVLRNLNMLNRKDWDRVEQKGFMSFRTSRAIKYYYENREVDRDFVDKYLRGNEIYIALEKDYGNQERVVVASIRNHRDTEAPIHDDTIVNVATGGNQFTLRNTYEPVNYGLGTIIIKDNRLVRSNSIKIEDDAYVVANRRFDDGQYFAGVVKISQKPKFDFAQIYRGRISQIQENREFKVSSFSILEGTDWNFYNTPKTFDITHDTRILYEEGIMNSRDFVGYGEDSYVDQVVYIVSDGVKALQVNFAPYGTYNLRGEIRGVLREEVNVEQEEDDENDEEVLGDVIGFDMFGVRWYDNAEYTWKESNDTSINVLNNSIIIKNNRLVLANELQKGDRVRVIKSDGIESGDGYIIIVEG